MLKQAKNVFFIGIKGVAMANLAVVLKKLGKKVDGSDVNEGFITDKLLKSNKINWRLGFNDLPEGVDLVVYSAAHGGLGNPLVIEAKRRSIKLVSQAELLGQLMRDFEIKIAVSGCHGKTTTSSLLSYALNELNVKPSYVVGVPFFTDYQGADNQGKKYFVVEADEYGVNPPQNKAPKFFELNPDWIICTNIDFDHPDVYRDIEETKKAFLKFFGLDPDFRRDDEYSPKLILNGDDKNLLQSINRLKNKNIITYGFSEKAKYQIIDWKIKENHSEFRIKRVGEFIISLFGKHNISNAAAVIVQLLQLGFKAEDIKKAILNFKGAERRFEYIYNKSDIYLFDDYAHHPSEIRATIEAAKNRFPEKRIIVIFQPHTFSRTRFLMKEFKESLSSADLGFILPIFSSARESKMDFKIDSKDIIKGKKNLFYVGSNEELIYQLENTVKEGDVIFTMGAGDVYKLKRSIIKIINGLTDYGLLIEKNKDISHFLTLRNHVKVEYFLEAKTRQDLINAKKYSIKNKIPLFILGGGSNLAITKRSLPGFVVKNSYSELKIIRENDSSIVVSISSGYSVSLLIAKSIQNGWSGFEYHQGLPGTVGGAIYMNSKWTKPMTYFGDNLLYAYLINSRGEVKKANRSYFQFAYDYSSLQKTHEIILEGIFELKKDDSVKIKERAKFALDYRKKTQPYGIASSGCFFRNPGKISAGYLIDKAGLKGFSIGDYFVSPVHANFIINKGNGKREDLLRLISIIKEKVREKFHIELKEEVILI